MLKTMCKTKSEVIQACCNLHKTYYKIFKYSYNIHKNYDIAELGKLYTLQLFYKKYFVMAKINKIFI